MRYRTISESLVRSLSLSQPPVAINFADTLPSGIDAFVGRVPAGCRFWQEAGSRAFATSAEDHSLCAIGVYTHNLPSSAKQRTDLSDVLKVFQELGYVRNEDLPLIPVLASPARHVIYSPLAETRLPPDIVLMFVNASQTLILSEAAAQMENQNTPAMGRPACAVVPQVMNTGRAALSLGCCGARAYLDVLDSGTSIFAIPGAKLEGYSNRIEVLAKANSLLSTFHEIRRRDVYDGRSPTIKESLAALAGN